MEESEISEEHGEKVVTAPPKTVEDKLEEHGVMKNGEITEPPPTLTPTEQQKVYKRKMTQARLDSLRRAREAKAKKKVEREKSKAEKAERVKDVVLPKDTPKAVTARPQAELKNEVISKPSPSPAPARAPAPSPTPKGVKGGNTKSESEEDRINRMVEGRVNAKLKSQVKPKTEREVRIDYFSKLMFG